MTSSRAMQVQSAAATAALLIAALALGVPSHAFMHQALGAMASKDITTGLLKSVVFGWIILVVGAFSGLGTQGGAEGVGMSTTRSVVVAIFSVIITDCIFSLAFYA